MSTPTNISRIGNVKHRDYATLSPADLEAEISAERARASIYAASLHTAQAALTEALQGLPRAGQMVGDVCTAAVALDRCERRQTRLVRELESRKATV